MMLDVHQIAHQMYLTFWGVLCYELFIFSWEKIQIFYAAWSFVLCNTVSTHFPFKPIISESWRLSPIYTSGTGHLSKLEINKVMTKEGAILRIIKCQNSSVFWYNGIKVFLFTSKNHVLIYCYSYRLQKNICKLQYLFIHSHISTDERNQLRKKCQRKDLVRSWVCRLISSTRR